MIVKLRVPEGRWKRLDLSYVHRISALSQSNILIVLKTGETINCSLIEFK